MTGNLSLCSEILILEDCKTTKVRKRFGRFGFGGTEMEPRAQGLVPAKHILVALNCIPHLLVEWLSTTVSACTFRLAFYLQSQPSTGITFSLQLSSPSVSPVTLGLPQR